MSRRARGGPSRSASSRPTAPRSATPTWAWSRSELRELLRWMILARRLDRECIALQRQGELTVYPRFEGQEARPGRRGVRPRARRLRLPVVPRAGGGARARRRRRPVPPVPPRDVARRPVRPARHAVRADLRPDRHPDLARGRLRDGPAAGRHRRRARSRTSATAAPSEGDFHEAREPRRPCSRAPAILFCQNNGWAISVPTASQTARRDLAARRGLRLPRRARRRQRRAGRLRASRARRVARARAGERPDADRGDDVPHRPALHRRRRRPLPRRGRGRALARASTRSSATGRGCSRAGTPTTRSSRHARRRPRPCATRDPRGRDRDAGRRPSEWMFDWAYADPPAVPARQRDGGARRWLR